MSDPFFPPYFMYPPPRHERQSVLVVEDDIQTQIYLDHILRSVNRNLSVDRVSTVEEAREYIDNIKKYDLVISDQFLKGGQTGLDFWNHCSDRHPNSQFMLISSSEIDHYLARFSPQTPRPAFLQKPIRADRLRNHIRDLLRKARYSVTLPAEVEVAPGESFRYFAALLVATIAFSGPIARVIGAGGGEPARLENLLREIWPEEKPGPLNPWFEKIPVPGSREELKKIRDIKPDFNDQIARRRPA